MFDFLISLILFWVALSLVPFLGLTYFILKIYHSLWFSCVSVLYPEVEFLRYSTIRTLLDTHRNQGIISVLLRIKGEAQLEAVRKHLQELVKRRNKSGNLAFPRLRHCLVTRCGTYAWLKGKFDLDQNLTVVPCSYKGRIVADHNIQDYVSDIVSKYLPQNLPPWQVVIIPVSPGDHHYILIKLHHVLLSEGLNIGDLLPLIPPTRQSTGYFASKSPVADVFKKPEAIPKLKERLTEELANTWNEFLSNHDPLERMELLKTTPSLPQFFAIVLITLVSVVKECRRGLKVINSDAFSQFKYISQTISRECFKRQVVLPVFLKSIIVTLNPISVMSFWIKTWYNITFACTIGIPLRMLRELKAVYSCLTLQYCADPNTLVGISYNYSPLLYNAFREILVDLKLLFYTPRNVVQDILLQKESLQSVTLCGRKSVAWSEPVKIEFIKAISRVTNVSETEVMLSSISHLLSNYLTQTNHVIPDDLAITLRNVNSNYIFATGPKVRAVSAMSGILCMNLPIIDPEKDSTLLDNLLKVKENFAYSLERQQILHLCTLMQTKYGFLGKFVPATLLGIYLRYLSRKFAVSVSEVTSRYPNVTQKTLWGKEVSSAIYWRPPQANTSISLCFNEYADHIKLGVMCDTQLVPHHAILARGFAEYFQDLGRSAGVVKMI